MDIKSIAEHVKWVKEGVCVYSCRYKGMDIEIGKGLDGPVGGPYTTVYVLKCNGFELSRGDEVKDLFDNVHNKDWKKYYRKQLKFS